MSISTDSLAAIAGNHIILTGKSNYQKWAWNIGGTARLGLFWAALEGTNTPIDTTAAQKEVCNQREMKALGLIMKSVDPIIALELQSMPDVSVTSGTTGTTRRPNANEIWNHLKSQYQKTDAISSLYDYRQLHQTALIDDGTLETQINNLIQLRSRCALNGFRLDDFQFAATLLIALPESYSHIADSLLTNGKIEDLSVEAVRAKILETEVRRKNDADPAANAIRRAAQSSSSKNKQKGSCFKCGKTGHYANRCRSKGSKNSSSTSSPPPKDLGQDVKAWGSKQGKPPTQSNVAVNNVESSSTEYDSTIFFYDRADIAAEPWLMDSGATDHMTPWSSDFASDPSDRKSVSGYIFQIAGGAFSWSSKKQQAVTTSTMEAEYHAAHSGSLNAIWVRQLFEQIFIPFDKPLILHCDNQGAIATAKAEQTHNVSKHIDLRIHSLREHIEKGFVVLDYVPSKGNLADVFTKSLPYEAHNDSVQGLGLGYIPTDDGEDTSVSQYLSVDSEGDSEEEGG